MKTHAVQKVLTLAFALTLVSLSATASSASGSVSAIIKRDNVESLIVKKDNNLYLTNALGETVQLTHDSIPKDLPLFSKDGSEIAYAERADRGGGKGMIVVINRQGHELYRVYVNPKHDVGVQAASDGPGGAPYFEHFQWLTNALIAVSGAINPSQSQNLIYHLPPRGAPYQFFDDGEVVYSPDGRRVAYETGMPHWARGGQRPTLDVVEGLGVDYDAITAYPAIPTSHIRFISSPRWSPDSQMVAILVQDLQAHALKLVMWNRSRTPSVTEAELPPTVATAALLPDASGNDQATVFYGVDGWVVTSKGGAWQLGADGKTFLPLKGNAALDPAVAPRTLRTKLEDSARNAGAVWSDFWCQSCSLSKLPRRSAHGT